MKLTCLLFRNIRSTLAQALALSTHFISVMLRTPAFGLFVVVVRLKVSSKMGN